LQRQNQTVHSLPVSDFGLASGFPAPKKDPKMFEPLTLQKRKNY
jgi:hypothetical protein